MDFRLKRSVFFLFNILLVGNHFPACPQNSCLVTEAITTGKIGLGSSTLNVFGGVASQFSIMSWFDCLVRFLIGFNTDFKTIAWICDTEELNLTFLAFCSV